MNQLTNISDVLPHGAMGEIAKKAGVCALTVKKVMTGKAKSPKVLTAIADYVEEWKLAEKEALQRITNALKG
ncbi:MAG: hypothetical protein V4714_22120 [Bacteroidota bacterium]